MELFENKFSMKRKIQNEYYNKTIEENQ